MPQNWKQNARDGKRKRETGQGIYCNWFCRIFIQNYCINCAGGSFFLYHKQSGECTLQWRRVSNRRASTHLAFTEIMFEPHNSGQPRERKKSIENENWYIIFRGCLCETSFLSHLRERAKPIWNNKHEHRFSWMLREYGLRVRWTQ